MKKTEKIKSILIVKLSSIGDVVHALPLLEVLRKNFPFARIDWLVEEESLQIIEGHPAIDQVIVSRKKIWQKKLTRITEWPGLAGEVTRFLKKIRSYKYDIVIDLQGLLKSGVLVGICRGKRKIGMAGAREGGWLFVNERSISVDYDHHAIDRYLQVAEYLGCTLFSWKGDIAISETDKKRVDKILEHDGKKNRPLVAINPMARWRTKLWEPYYFAELADRLQHDLACKVIFTGSKYDRMIIEEIMDLMNKKTINLAGRTTLKELACLYSGCSVLISTDTGPMHIAAAMGCRVVALFGPTAPWRTGPYGENNMVITGEEECSPCFKKRCEDIRCMKSISPDMVYDKVKNIIME